MTRIRIDDLPIAEELTPEQEALIQGAGLKSFRPSLEALEARDVPALIAPGIDLTGTTLTFQAGASNTRNYFANYGANVSLNGANQVMAQTIRIGRESEPVFLDRSQVTNIVFEGGLGKDTFTNNTGIRSSIGGGGLNPTEGDTHVRFSMNGPSILPPESASGQTAINGSRVGSNTPPSISWENLPRDTATLDLTMTDPDAGPGYGPNGYTHMVLNNIPARARNLSDALALGTLGVNSRGRREYYGPNPPEMENQPDVSERLGYVWTLTAKDATGRVIGQTQFTSEFGYESGTRTNSGVNN